MWVRSQDKTGLFMSHDLYINEFDGKFSISDGGGFGSCATYSTKAKALKVLDEIQRLIQSNESSQVYEMPKDDEVKI